MANWFLDHGCTLYPTAYMAAPGTAAGLPQDGDGKASGTGAAPASASASMDFTGVTAAAGATFQAMGATLTGVASAAGTTQFNVGSGATLAANLAAAINAATASPSVTTGGLASPYLKGLVWAVAAGAVLTVHSRIASADLNQASNASCILACATLGNWTSPPANANFSGGVSGPWSLFFNVAALASTISASVGGLGTYGAFTATMMGAPTGGDSVFIRTARGGSNIEIVLPSTANFSVVGRQVGSPSAYLRYKPDAGVVWAGENGRLIISKSAGNFAASIGARGYTHIDGGTISGAAVQQGGVPQVLFRNTHTDSAGYILSVVLPSTPNTHHTIVSGLETYDAGNGAYVNQAALQLTNGSFVVDNTNPARLVNSKLGHMVRPGGSAFQFVPNFGAGFEAVDCLLAYGSATTYTQAIAAMTTSSGAPINARLIRPKFTGGGGGHHTLLRAVAPVGHSAKLYIEDPVDMGQFVISDSSASVCGAVAGATTFNNQPFEDYVAQLLVSSNGDFVIDNVRYLLESRDAGFPTSGFSVLPNGREFSVRFSVVPTALGQFVSQMNPQRALREVVVNTLGDNNLVLTQRLLIDSLFGGSAYSPADNEWWIEGTYIGTDGLTKAFTTKGSGTAIASDSTAWSALAYTPFAGELRNYSRWKIAATLTGVKSGTDVILRLMCAKQPSSMTEWCFIDPVPSLAVA